RRDIVGERRQRNLNGRDVVALGLEDRDHPCPARPVGKGAVNENDVLDWLRERSTDSGDERCDGNESDKDTSKASAAREGVHARSPFLCGLRWFPSTRQIEDGIGERLRRLLGQVVPDTALNEPVFIPTRELLRVSAGFGMRRTVRVALEGDRGHGNDRSLGQ